MSQAQPTFNRPYLSVMFDCCRVYNRIYINADGTAYSGRCPKCLQGFTAQINPQGTTHRAFRVH